jgi:hypothetical protein
MNNRDHISECVETIFWVKILTFFDADPGWEKFGSGINIPESAILLFKTQTVVNGLYCKKARRYQPCFDFLVSRI